MHHMIMIVQTIFKSLSLYQVESMSPGVNYPPVVSHSTFCIFTISVEALVAAWPPTYSHHSTVYCLLLSQTWSVWHSRGPVMIWVGGDLYQSYCYCVQLYIGAIRTCIILKYIIYSNRFSLTSLHWSWENISTDLCN